MAFGSELSVSLSAEVLKTRSGVFTLGVVAAFKNLVPQQLLLLLDDCFADLHLLSLQHCFF